MNQSKRKSYSISDKFEILKKYDELAGTSKQVQIVRNLKIEPSILPLILKKRNEIERKIAEVVTKMKKTRKL